MNTLADVLRRLAHFLRGHRWFNDVRPFGVTFPSERDFCIVCKAVRP